MPDPQQKPSPGTPADSNMAIPIASPRGQYKVGDEVTMYGQTVPVTGLNKDGSPVFSIPPGRMDMTKGSGQVTKVQPTVKRGQWLANRLRELYNDPVYAKAKPEVQEYYKTKAYNKWVIPYYKHIKETPMPLENFIHGGQNPAVADRIFKDQLASYSARDAHAVLKQSSKFLSGVSSLLDTIAEFSEKMESGFFHKNLTEEITGKHEINPIRKYLQTSENYYDKQAQDMEDRIQDLGGHTIETHAAELGTQAVFFEATGAAKAANLLKITNPRTAAVVTKTVQKLWNGAVTGTLWGVSSGDKSSELPHDAAGFALADLGLSAASSGFMKVFGRYFTKSIASTTLEETAKDLVEGKGVTVPKQEEFLKGSEQVNKQASKAATAKVLNEAAQNMTGGDTVGAFKRMSPRQQKALLLRLSVAMDKAKQFDLSDEVKTEFVKEEEQKMQSVVPVAAKVQQEVDSFITKAGLDPTQAKIGATLPRHTTTLDSPIQHVSARISWLTNQLKASGRNELIMSEIDTFKEALKQEKELYSKIKSRQQSVSHGSGGLSAEEAKRPGKNYVISRGGLKVTYHGKAFDPGGVEQGATHVTVLPDGSFRVNEGVLTKSQEAALRKALKEQ